MVLTIIAYSLSASSDRRSKILSQTPLLAHRLNRVCTASDRQSAPAGPATECRLDTVDHGLDEQPIVFAVTPTWPSRPGKISLIRSHWSSRMA